MRSTAPSSTSAASMARESRPRANRSSEPCTREASGAVSDGESMKRNDAPHVCTRQGNGGIRLEPHPARTIFPSPITLGEFTVKMAVCIKRVADMETRFRIAADGRSVDQAGLKFDISDFDGYAVEVALRIKEKEGQGDITVLSLGPDIVQEQLRKARS